MTSDHQAQSSSQALRTGIGMFTNHAIPDPVVEQVLLSTDYRGVLQAQMCCHALCSLIRTSNAPLLHIHVPTDFELPEAIERAPDRGTIVLSSQYRYDTLARTLVFSRSVTVVAEQVTSAEPPPLPHHAGHNPASRPQIHTMIDCELDALDDTYNDAGCISGVVVDAGCGTVRIQGIDVVGSNALTACALTVRAGTVELEHCSLESSTDGAVKIQQGSTAAFTRCSVSSRGYNSVQVNAANLTMEECVIGPSGSNGLMLQSNSRASLKRCSIADTDSDWIAVAAWSGSQAVLEQCTLDNTGKSVVDVLDGTKHRAKLVMRECMVAGVSTSHTFKHGMSC